MSGAKKSDLGRVLELVNGYRATCVITAALELGVFERLAAGPRSVEALAAELAVDARALGRLVRGLALLALVEHGDAIALTSAGKLLVAGGFGVRDWAHLVGAEYLAAWGALAESVRGGSAFEHVFGTTPWRHREAHPEDDAAFNRVMAGAQARASAALLDAWDFSAARRIVDVGGGRGHLLAAVLKRHPEARGVLFDQPHVVDGAAAGLEAVAGRITIVGGSFLETVPAGDVLLIKHCLHNWDDAACVTILGHCRAALGDGALLVLEDVMPAGDAPEALVMLDLHMLVVGGGRERTLAEYEALLSAAGLRLDAHVATREGAPDVLVARRREAS